MISLTLQAKEASKEAKRIQTVEAKHRLDVEIRSKEIRPSANAVVQAHSLSAAVPGDSSPTEIDIGTLARTDLMVSIKSSTSQHEISQSVESSSILLSRSNSSAIAAMASAAAAARVSGKVEESFPTSEIGAEPFDEHLSPSLHHTASVFHEHTKDTSKTFPDESVDAGTVNDATNKKAKDDSMVTPESENSTGCNQAKWLAAVLSSVQKQNT